MVETTVLNDRIRIILGTLFLYHTLGFVHTIVFNEYRRTEPDRNVFFYKAETW